MGKFFTIHRAGKEAMKNFFAVSFFILLIAGIGGAIVWFLMVRPMQDEKQQAPVTTEQVDTPPTPQPPSTATKPASPKSNEEKKPWEKGEDTEKEKPKSNQINKLF